MSHRHLWTYATVLQYSTLKTLSTRQHVQDRVHSVLRGPWRWAARGLWRWATSSAGSLDREQ